MGTATENYEKISSIIQFLSTQAGKHFGGPFGRAYATFLTGQNSFLASVADLSEKIKNGTATGEEYADVLSKAASTLAGFGFIAGLAAPWTLGATAAASAGLAAWENRQSIGDFFEGFFKKYAGEITVSFGGEENFPLLITTLTYADGSYKVTLHDDLGQSTTSEYTTDGRLTHKSWQNADGSRGDTQYRADGSSSGIVVRADGSYQRFADDGKGTSVLIQYDANGNQTRQQWHNADGSYGAEYTDPNGQRHGTAYAPNGSYRNYTLDPDGRLQSNTFDSDGRFISSEWNDPATETRGGMGYNAKGELISFTHLAGGGVIVQTWKNNGTITQTRTDANGRERYGSLDDNNGLRIETTYDGDGHLTSNRHIHYNPDGSGTIKGDFGDTKQIRSPIADWANTSRMKTSLEQTKKSTAKTPNRCFCALL